MSKVKFPTTQSEPQSYSDVVDQIVNECLRQMAIIKPSLNYTSFKTPDEKEMYGAQLLTAFNESGINSVSQIKIGLKRLREDASDFAPSIGKFVLWCKPTLSEMGLLEPYHAYKEASVNCGSNSGNRSWSHKVVWHAARKTGFLELKSERRQDIFKQFEKDYAEVVRAFIAGEDLCEIPECIEHKKYDKCDQATSQQHVKNLRNILND